MERVVGKSGQEILRKDCGDSFLERQTNMRVLVHMCCGPCGITVLQRLQDKGCDCTGFFFNPNIHPLAEYMRRREGAAQVAERLGVPLIFADTLPHGEQQWSPAWPGAGIAAAAAAVEAETPPPASGQLSLTPPYTSLHIPEIPEGLPPAADPVLWLRAVSGREEDRCRFCWYTRLRKTAELARQWGFAGFTSSLLYSRYQKHEALQSFGQALAGENGIAFVYEDFRTSWQQGITVSKEWGIYRQQYCGCIFSEYDRYRRDLKRMCRVSRVSQGADGNKDRNGSGQNKIPSGHGKG